MNGPSGDLIVEVHRNSDADRSPLQIVSADLLAAYRALAKRCAACPSCKMNDSEQENRDNAGSDPAS